MVIVETFGRWMQPRAPTAHSPDREHIAVTRHGP